MRIFGISSPFDQDVERATNEKNTSEKWGLIMEICDRAGTSSTNAKNCLRAILRRLAHPDPHVQVLAATLLDACVANCGRIFHLEVASRDFETEFRRLLSRTQPIIATRLRAMLRKWAEGEFRDDPQLNLIPSFYAKLRAEGREPSAATASASPSLPGVSAAERRERDDLAQAIALSLRVSAPSTTTPRVTLYPRIDAPSPPPADSMPRRLRALYDFETTDENDLMFFAGEIERATSENNTSEEWGLIMDICDRAGASSTNAKNCLRAVLRRLGHPDPHVQGQAATLLDACVANCGRVFHLEVASRNFETEFRRLLSRTQPIIANRLRAMMHKWAEGEFRDDPQLHLIPLFNAKLCAEGHDSLASKACTSPSSPGVPVAARHERNDLAQAIALSMRDLAPSATPRAMPPCVRALYDFEAVEPNELTFVAGEIVHVTDSSDPNWWRGFNSRGEGLFPANFVTSDSEGKAAVESTAGVGTKEEVEAVDVAGIEACDIDEAEMNAVLAALHEADPAVAGRGERRRLEAREARALAMGALVDAALERADTRHARLTQLSAELVDALNLYHELMRAPPPPPLLPSQPSLAMYAVGAMCSQTGGAQPPAPAPQPPR